MRLPHQPGKTTHIEKMLAADNRAQPHDRASCCKQRSTRAARLVVFSTLHDHLKALHRACIEAFRAFRAGKMGFYIGATTKAEKDAREREKVKPILFTTYAMMCEGTSLDWLDTCILAMPRSSVDAARGAHPARVSRQGARRSSWTSSIPTARCSRATRNVASQVVSSRSAAS